MVPEVTGSKEQRLPHEVVPLEPEGLAQVRWVPGLFLLGGGAAWVSETLVVRGELVKGRAGGQDVVLVEAVTFLAC